MPSPLAELRLRTGNLARLAVLVVAALPAACADGCGCGGPESPQVPDSAVGQGDFDALTVEVAPPPAPEPPAAAQQDAVSTAFVVADAGTEVTPEAEPTEGSGGLTTPAPTAFQRPRLELRTIQPNRVSPTVAPRVVRPTVPVAPVVSPSSTER